MTSTPPAFGTQLIGQTANALGAILDCQLDGSGLTQRHWVTLTLAVMSGGSIDQAALIGRVSGALNLTTTPPGAGISSTRSSDRHSAPTDPAPNPPRASATRRPAGAGGRP